MSAENISKIIRNGMMSESAWNGSKDKKNRSKNNRRMSR